MKCFEHFTLAEREPEDNVIDVIRVIPPHRFRVKGPDVADGDVVTRMPTGIIMGDEGGVDKILNSRASFRDE